MKKLLLAAFFLLSSLGLHAQTTPVTGNLKTVLGENLGTNTFVRFRLRNYKPNRPLVEGVGIIGQTTKDVTPDSSGLVSTTVYDNDFIDPTNTFYTLEFYLQGRFVFAASYEITGSTFDFNTANPISTVPTAAIPTLESRVFTHIQSSAATTWTIIHSFGVREVTLDFYDNSFNRIFPDLVTLTDINTVTALFVVAQAGRAVVMRAENVSLSSSTGDFLLKTPTTAQSITGGFDLTLDGNFLLALTGQNIGSPTVRPDAFLETVIVGVLNNRRKCDSGKYVGADAGAKIIACISDLPSTGGVADATGFEGVPNGTSTIVIPDDVLLLLGAAVLTSSATPNFSLGNRSCLIGLGKHITEVANSGTGNSVDIIGTASPRKQAGCVLGIHFTTSTAAIGIKLEFANGYTIRGVRLGDGTNGFSAAGIQFSTDSWLNEVSDSWIQSSVIGIELLGGHNGVRILNNDFDGDNTQDLVASTSSSGLYLEGNNFGSNPASPATYNVSISDAFSLTVMGGRSETNATNSFRLSNVRGALFDGVHYVGSSTSVVSMTGSTRNVVFAAGRSAGHTNFINYEDGTTLNVGIYGTDITDTNTFTGSSPAPNVFGKGGTADLDLAGDIEIDGDIQFQGTDTRVVETVGNALVTVRSGRTDVGGNALLLSANNSSSTPRNRLLFRAGDAPQEATLSDNFVPDTTGRDLGSGSARWDAFLETVTTGILNNVRVVDGNKFATTLQGIQDAIDDLTGTGGQTSLMGGITYSGATPTITLPTLVSLVGSGTHNTLLNYTGTGSAIDFSGISSRLAHFRVGATSSALSPIINIDQSETVLFDVDARDATAADSCIKIDGDISYITLLRVSAFDCNRGLYVLGTNPTVVNSYSGRYNAEVSGSGGVAGIDLDAGGGSVIIGGSVESSPTSHIRIDNNNSRIAFVWMEGAATNGILATSGANELAILFNMYDAQSTFVNLSAFDGSLALDEVDTSVPLPRFIRRADGTAPTLASASTTVGYFQNSNLVSDVARLGIYSGNTGQSILELGDVDDTDTGAVIYNQNTETMQFRVNNSTGASLDSNGFTVTNDTTSDRFFTSDTALVAGDIVIATTGAWGDTSDAVVGSVTGTDQWFQWTITAGGANTGADPTIVITFTDGTWTNAPIVLCNRQDFNAPATVTVTVTTVTATVLTLTFDGTPTATNTYRFACHVGGI